MRRATSQRSQLEALTFLATIASTAFVGLFWPVWASRAFRGLDGAELEHPAVAPGISKR